MENVLIIEWWHWVLGGLGLVLLELALPSFFVIWFGLSALLVGLSVLVLPTLSLTAQIALWIITSVVLVVLWFSVFKRSQHKTLIGTAAGEVIGEVGLLVSAVAPFQRGKVRFQRPLLGARLPKLSLPSLPQAAPSQRKVLIFVALLIAASCPCFAGRNAVAFAPLALPLSPIHI